MKALKPFYVLCLMTFLILSGAANAEVSPGDVIDKSNWQSVEGHVPESVLNWVKNGDIVMNIGKLNYRPYEYAKAIVEDTFESNKGKYAIADDVIVDAATGKEPEFILGWPFPEIDPEDPEAGIKFIYNRQYLVLGYGNVSIPSLDFVFVDGEDGLVRKADMAYYQNPMDGWEKARNIPNPDSLLRYQMFKFQAPYDISGTALMTWRYLGDKRDVVFAYVPSIRRVRRLTPSNRSDAIIGSDACYDDAWGFDGKISDFEWKLIGNQEGFLPYLSEDVQPLIKPKPGVYQNDPSTKDIVYGYQKDGWTGAQWAPTNIIWVKRPMYILEGVSKDPYYNFGTTYLWMDAETGMALVKVIHDRSGEYWKTCLISGADFECKEDGKKMAIYSLQEFIDDRNNRATYVTAMGSKTPYIFGDEMDLNNYSLAGFAKFCK
ncbi:MAG: DUF1329 domain-containing protein [Desulfobacterales bacterium]